MGARVIAKFEQRIGQELARSGVVRAHPLATSKQRGFDAVCAQIVENSAVVASDFAGLLTQVERQGDELFALGKLNTADRATQLGADRFKGRKRAWWFGSIKRVIALLRMLFAGNSKQRLRCITALSCRSDAWRNEAYKKDCNADQLQNKYLNNYWPRNCGLRFSRKARRPSA